MHTGAQVHIVQITDLDFKPQTLVFYSQTLKLLNFQTSFIPQNSPQAFIRVDFSGFFR